MSKPFELFVTRKRASTRAVLGDLYREQPREKPPVPRPGMAKDYTDQRLREGLSYADETLRNKNRKPSPLGQKALILYKTAVKAMLGREYDDEDGRNYLLAYIRTCEDSILARSFLRPAENAEQGTLFERLSELRRYEFAARYGDYLARVCEMLKEGAKEHQTQYWQQLHGWSTYWTDINASLSKEETKFNRWRSRDKSVQDEDIKTSLAVFNACTEIGLDYDDMASSIAMYADRNSLVHQSLNRLIENGQFDKLKALLARDLKELSTIMPANLIHHEKQLRCIVQAIINEKFDTEAMGDPDNHETWIPRPVLAQQRKDLVADRKRREENILKDRETIAKIASQKYKQQIGHMSVAIQTSEEKGRFKPEAPGKPPKGTKDSILGKGPADEKDYEKRQETYKRQKKAFTTIISIQQRKNTITESYLDEYGSLEMPIDPADIWGAEFEKQEQASGST